MIIAASYYITRFCNNYYISYEFDHAGEEHDLLSGVLNINICLPVMSTTAILECDVELGAYVNAIYRPSGEKHGSSTR